MISLYEALRIHELLIDRFGGTHGLRDQAALESALARPHATFDLKDLYPSPAHKAAAIFESIVINHPFVDGNKRMGYVLMRLTLMVSGQDIDATQDEKYEVAVSLAKGDIDFDPVLLWIQDHLKQTLL